LLPSASTVFFNDFGRYFYIITGHRRSGNPLVYIIYDMPPVLQCEVATVAPAVEAID